MIVNTMKLQIASLLLSLPLAALAQEGGIATQTLIHSDSKDHLVPAAAAMTV